jgi:uncharacterized protein YigE (DUF2233 family)
LAAVAALAAAAFAITQHNTGLRWKSLGPGLEFTTMRGDPYCRRGSSQLAVLRLDPRRVDIRVHHYTRQPGREPLTIGEWQRRTGAAAVFNAGQYYPDYSYMGLLVSRGEVISSRIHSRYRAVLVAAPSAGGRGARVLDLDRDRLDRRHPAWKEVAQSFMLFDRNGTTRVRKSDQVANRTVVAEDKSGRLVVITSEGGYTLWDFSRLLREGNLGLSHAMSMDGGYEAELCVSTKDFRYASFGRWTGEEESSAPGARVPLPAVISVDLP